MLSRGSKGSTSVAPSEPLLLQEGTVVYEKRENEDRGLLGIAIRPTSRVSFAAHSVIPIVPRKQYRPFLMAVVILVNFIVFIWEMSENHWQFAPASVNPMYGPAPSVLVKCGAKDAHHIVALGEKWRLFTSMFLHGGILHLLMNMLGVFRLGCDYERQFGALKVGVVYFVAGIFSTMTSTILSPSMLSLGASGAMFGFIGACWSDFIQNYNMIAHRVSFFSGLFVSTLLSLCLGLLPWLDTFAHFGGFYIGFFLGLCVFVTPRIHRDGSIKPKLPYQKVLMGVGAVISLVSIVLTYYFMSQAYDIAQVCPWCQYLSCIPTPWWSCTFSSGACDLVSSLANGTIVIRCPDGDTFSSNGIYSEALCRQLCVM